MHNNEDKDKTILLSSKPVEISEYKDYKLATFLISVLDEYDLSGRMIPRSVAEKCGETIIGAPILAKLIYDPFTGKPCDFGGHETYWTVDDDGRDVIKFGTEPIGGVTKQWIESRKIEGFDTPKECLMIQAKIWVSRFPEYAKVLDKLLEEGKVSSSWELTVHDEEWTSAGRILRDITFIGNCIIGVYPAVPQAGITEYASVKDNHDELSLAVALSKDMAAIARDENDQKGKEPMDNQMTPETNTAESTAPVENPSTAESTTTVENPPVAQDPVPTLSYEIKDNQVSVSGCEDEHVIAMIGDVNNAFSSLADQLAKANDALEKANSLVNDLNAEIASLKPFKEEHDRAEAEKAAAELQAKRDAVRDMFIRSERVSEDELGTESFRKIIEDADMAAAKSIVADRFMASMPERGIETASADKASPRIDLDEDRTDISKILRTYKH